MITALIITVTVAIIFIALFLDERGTVKEYRDENKSQRTEITRLSEVARKASSEHGEALVSRPPVDDQDNWALTPDLVADVVRYNGYVPDRKDGAVFFMIQGEHYCVTTDMLPCVAIMKRFGIHEGEYNIPLMREAAGKATLKRFMGKVGVSEDGKTLTFLTTSLETKYGNFRDVFNDMVSVVNDMENLFGETYNQMLSDKEDISKLGANGIPIEAVGNREGKIVS